MERWKDGKMERWKDGKMERWKDGKFFCTLILFLFILSCEMGTFETKDEDKKIPSTNRSVVNIKAYEGLDIDQVRKQLFYLKFKKKKKLRQSLDVIRNTDFKPSRIRFLIKHDTDRIPGQGRLMLRNGKSTRENQIKDDLDNFINYIKKKFVLRHNIKDACLDLTANDVEITGFEIISNKEAVQRTRSENFTISRIYPDDILENTSQQPKTRMRWNDEDNYSSPDNYYPDAHGFDIYTKNTNYNSNTRVFEWHGRWTSQNLLNNLHQGISPAFEPDLAIETAAGRRWAMSDPDANAYAVWSNMPNSYIDTQWFDIKFETYTVGSTSAELFNLNETYYYTIWSPPDNPYGNLKMQYKLDHWQESGSIEGWPWSVGLYWNGDETQSTLEFIVDGYNTEELPQTNYYIWDEKINFSNQVTEIRNRYSGKLLSPRNYSTSTWSELTQYNRSTGENLYSQRWIFEPAGDGLYYIRNQRSGLYLDVYYHSYNPGTKIIQYNLNYGDNQKWEVVPVGDFWLLDKMYYNIIARHSGMCIELPQYTTSAVTMCQNGINYYAINQQWEIY